MKYPAIHKIYDASDEIVEGNKNVVATVTDYWKWAHSDLMDNTERGIYAEFLVAKAVGDSRSHRVNWDKYDVISSEGIRIEVKTSAYLQAWGQDKLSAIRFNIGKTYGYDDETNSYDTIKKRQADIYVFCVLNEINQDNLNLLDITQWDFYVISTKTIDQNPNYKNKTTISLSPLIE